jgi:hypothetical protein
MLIASSACAVCNWAVKPRFILIILFEDKKKQMTIRLTTVSNMIPMTIIISQKRGLHRTWYKYQKEAEFYSI